MRRFVILLVVVMFITPPVRAQEKQGDQRPPTNRELAIGAAMSVLAPGDCFGVISARVVWSQDAFLVGMDKRGVESPENWGFSFKEPLPIRRAFLDGIRDHRPIPTPPP